MLPLHIYRKSEKKNEKKSIKNHRIWRGKKGEGKTEVMYSKASHFRVALRAGSAVVAPDPLISLSINSYLYLYCLLSSFLVLIRLRGHLATETLGSTMPHSF